MSRLSIEVTPEQHNAIKAMALLDGINIKEYVIKRIFNGELSVKKPNARLKAAIKEAIKIEKEIKKGTKKSYKTTKEVFDRYR